jgi:hypothetical protein
MANSTIKQKMGICPMCVDGRLKPLLSGKCQHHYWYLRAQISEERKEKREPARKPKRVLVESDLPELIDEADLKFSRWMRIAASDDNGYITCYTCDQVLRWQDSQLMHFVKRGNKLLRYDVRNCRVGCQTCNEIKDGNYEEYVPRLEREFPGITDILLEESVLAYRPSRFELIAIIDECSAKYKAEAKKRP